MIELLIIIAIVMMVILLSKKPGGLEVKKHQESDSELKPEDATLVLADYPIENYIGDKLRRAPLAKKVAELIARFKGKESFVIGIEGKWGAGKTSFINMVLRNIENDPNLIFIHFNPWNFTGQNELIDDFFSALLEALEGKVNKDVIDTFKSYAGKLQISYSPEFSTPIGSFGVGNLNKNKNSIKKQRDKIDRTLRGLDKKIVVVIDDTDRLDEDETKLIMKLVKMTANFPNTVFLLACDREQVAKKLGKDGVGEEYLKKIIQVSFTLPIPDEQGLRKILSSDLEDTIKNVYDIEEVTLEGNDEKRWNDLLYKGFQKPFQTIRDIKRYISSLRLNWSIVEREDVNQIDFIAIEAIRVFAPKVYSGIAANQSLFTGLHHHLSSGDDAKKNLNLKLNELIDELPVELREPIRGTCEVLFPQLDNGNYGSDWQKEWKREKRICVPERFGFYFQLGIPDGAISEVEVTALAETFENADIFSERIKELAKDKKLRPMLIKVLDRVDTLNDNQMEVVISSLWNLENEIADERIEMFDFDDVKTQISRISYHAIKQLPKDKRFEMIVRLVTNSKVFYAPTYFVAIITDEKKTEQQTEDPLITSEEAEKLKALSLAEIKKLADNGGLKNNPRELVFALFRWKDWENEDIVKIYIKNLISTTEGLLTFLKGFVGRVLSTTGNYYKLNKNEIDPLYPSKEIEVLVEQISEKEISDLKDEDKQAINLFKKPPSRDW